MTLTNLNPGLIFLEDKYINVENVKQYTANKENLFLSFEYYSGSTDLIRFGSIQELHKAVLKVERAQRILTMGIIYGK